MPLFDYICKDCRKRFEALVSSTRKPECPLCRSTNLDQQLSTFAVSAGGAKAKAAAACAGGAGGA